MSIRTTHVGSLVRPDELIEYMHAIDRGEPISEAGYTECLARSVRDVVRRQRDAGVDIVCDGEFGKSSWNFYVYERLGGIELRPLPGGRFGELRSRATDWERFPEFYAEYFAAEQDVRASPAGRVRRGRPDHLHRRQGDRAATSPTCRPRWTAEGVQQGFLPVVAPASCFPDAVDEHYGSTRRR